MTTLRINLHIRADVSPRLHATLAAMSPRPRAERLRRLAELGLQIEGSQLQSLMVGSRATPMPANRSSLSSSEAIDTATDEFSDDLANLLEMTSMVPASDGTR